MLLKGHLVKDCCLMAVQAAPQPKGAMRKENLEEEDCSLAWLEALLRVRPMAALKAALKAKAQQPRGGQAVVMLREDLAGYLLAWS